MFSYLNGLILVKWWRGFFGKHGSVCLPIKRIQNHRAQKLGSIRMVLCFMRSILSLFSNFYSSLNIALSQHTLYIFSKSQKHKVWNIFSRYILRGAKSSIFQNIFLRAFSLFFFAHFNLFVVPLFCLL